MQLGDETIDRGELLCLGDRIAESGLFMTVGAGFADTVDDRIYTVIAGLHAGLQGPNFESRRGTTFCDLESPFPQSQQTLFLPFYTDYLATNIHDLHTIIAGIGCRLLSGTHDVCRDPISSCDDQKSGAKGPH